MALSALSHTSKIVKGHAKAFSLRVTIPKEIAESMGFKAGDTLDFTVVTHDDKKGVFIRKLE